MESEPGVRIPPVLNRAERVVGRGWLTTERDYLTLTPGEHRAAGIRLAGLVVQDRSLRYEVLGRLDDRGSLHVDRIESCRSQRRPELHADDMRALGCVASIPYGRWRAIAAGWPPDSPIHRLAASSWGSGIDVVSEVGIRRRLHAGRAVVVRWMTPELRDWLATVPPPDSVVAIPLISNEARDLLP